MKAADIDWSDRHPHPSAAALAVATMLSAASSLAADSLLVIIGTRVSASTTGYVHFRFSDYATLTIIGVLIACMAWPIVTWVSSAPRRLLFRLAVAVTLVLLLPDLYLLIRHQPIRAVGVLMAMHLAIATVTYNILVRVAPVREASAPVSNSVELPSKQGESAPVIGDEIAPEPASGTEPSGRRLATVLAILVGVEFVLGIVALLFVPTGRPTGWLPNNGTTIYLVHAILGLPLTLGALTLLARVRESTHIYVLSGWIGCVGVAIAGSGGLLTVAHPLRLVGLVFMLVGPIVAGFGYMLPTLDRLSDGTPPRGDG
jgi:hypothetical protein